MPDALIAQDQPGPREADCVFCRIVRGEAPCFPVFEDERTFVFMDLFPVARGHTLIVTKEHFTDIFESDAEALAAVAQTSLRVAKAIELALVPDGLGVFQLNRAAAGQTVFHYHMHLIPRSEGQPLALHSRVRGEDEELRETSLRISGAL